MTSNEKAIKIFEYALNQERTGMSFFQHSLELMGVGAAVTAFKRLIQEEESHIIFISNILDALRRPGLIDIDLVESVTLKPMNYFDERARSEFLEKCVEGSMVPDVTVFNAAWLIEKDLSEFYAEMAGKTDGEARQALTMLSEWEKAHEKFFREYRDKLHEVYAHMPWGG